MKPKRTFLVTYTEPDGESTPHRVDAENSAAAVVIVRAGTKPGTVINKVDLKTGPYSWQPVEPYFWRGK